ncbi:MAG TPA: RsmE family RNA methyltransferase [Ilumatobacteraceae bacterium]|nr:RsmE family RNA methyltransferase [Ilumatobacteraceae bacterium]
MNPALRGSAAHVFVDSLSAPKLEPADDHHLRRVLRIRPSDLVTVSDGAGVWVTARLEADGLQLDSDAVSEPRPARSVVLSAIPKGERVEWMVQKLTELGVTAIGFVDCARSVVRWDPERATRQLVRLRRIAREAAMQSRRVWLPEVDHVGSFVDAAKRACAALADPDGARRIDADVDTIVIGPEGGFTPDELAIVAKRVALSANVLRIETAAVAAAAMLTLRNELD